MSSTTKPKHYQQQAKSLDPTGDVLAFIHNHGLNFHRGNAVKYLARAGKKDPSKEIEDLQKAIVYISREIDNLEREKSAKDWEKRQKEIISKGL